MSQNHFFQLGARFITWTGTKRYGWICGLSIFFALGLGHFAANNTFDYELNDMMGDKDEAFRRFQECLEVFGPDDDIVIALPVKELNGNSLRDALKVRKAITGIKGIEGIFDLAMAAGLKDERSLDRILNRPRLLGRQIEEIRKSRILKGYILGKDEKAQAIIVRSVPLGSKEKQEVVRNVRKEIERTCGDLEVYFAGYPVFAERYVYHMIRGNSFFLVLSICTALVISFLMLRSFWLTFGVAITIILPVIWTHGIFAVLGYKISLFSTLLTPIILFIGLSLSIQVIARFKLVLERNRLKQKENYEHIVFETFEESLPPSFFCTLAAVAGFSSQVFSNMAGVRTFGIFSTIGSFIAFLSVCFVLPGILMKWVGPNLDRKKIERTLGFERFIGRFLAGCLFPPFLIYLVAIFFTAMAGWGIAFLQLGSEPIAALPKDDLAVKGQRFINKHFFLGDRQISMIIKAGQASFEKLGSIQKIWKFKELVASDPDVVSVLTPGMILSDSLERLSGNPRQVPDSDFEVNQALRLAFSNAPKLLCSFFNHPFYDRARLVVGLRCSDAPGVVRAAARLEKICNEAGKGEFSALVTGRMFLSAVIENDALIMEITSFSTALVGILFIIGLGFGTFRAAFVGFVANFLPLIMSLGTMGWMGKSLDPVTAMVPCLCLGIIVDDTIHIFHEMDSEERKGHGPWRSRANLMFRMGWAIISASLIPILGLGILCFSDFGPIKNFGVYAVLAMLYGIFFDLFLTPALLTLTKPKKS